jgi:hypothetical protein
MAPSRLIGLVFLLFLVCVPLTYVMQNVAREADESLPLIDEEEQRDDPIEDVYCLKGLAAMGDHPFDKAIAAYTAAIEHDPKSNAYLGHGPLASTPGGYGTSSQSTNSMSRVKAFRRCSRG